MLSFENAFRLKGDSDKSLNNKAVAFLSLGRPEDALRDLEKALNINPGNIGIINNKGIALIDCKR